MTDITKDPKPYISLEALLFGAIALNLITLMCGVSAFGGWLVLDLTYILFTNYLRGVTLFLIALGGAAFISQFIQFCLWGARGFIDRRALPMVTVGIFFTLYGISGVYSGVVDGYVALSTVLITGSVIIINNRAKCILIIRSIFT